MIKLVVSLLIAFPKIANVLFTIQNLYVKEVKNRRYNRNSKLIDEWVRDCKEESGSRVPTGTEQPRI
tara:strand:- start:254 stop:454 length:201 start_codon:yes stop_codon:yes gene_type:complete